MFSIVLFTISDSLEHKSKGTSAFKRDGGIPGLGHEHSGVGTDAFVLDAVKFALEALNHILLEFLILLSFSLFLALNNLSVISTGLITPILNSIRLDIFGWLLSKHLCELLHSFG